MLISHAFSYGAHFDPKYEISFAHNFIFLVWRKGENFTERLMFVNAQIFHSFENEQTRGDIIHREETTDNENIEHTENTTAEDTSFDEATGNEGNKGNPSNENNVREGSALIAAIRREVEQRGVRSNANTQNDITHNAAGSIPNVTYHVLSILARSVIMFTDISNFVISLEIMNNTSQLVTTNLKEICPFFNSDSDEDSNATTSLTTTMATSSSTYSSTSAHSPSSSSSIADLSYSIPQEIFSSAADVVHFFLFSYSSSSSFEGMPLLFNGSNAQETHFLLFEARKTMLRIMQ
ncbi:uncharacterized protein MONOS_14948 [Monocercomonoides exilis]|uniref:uncharacterized protein n=1 Tax=Monocercomonoides exilis TaxID=2049356 RepID=UPI003559559D|nr:hypothetical protein MONOS_14948 [Monocercomonoides exilis]|eukprot:MONOS_14948.1-p1 / transcript=MONOS_14948.1 / gene=MONOS_14948 / organism=Monocercomonoides_exilis_PA203 / gene_product=unspecified product / transcript_product=unspecified product / location=Mono_scaffold01113:1342-2220(+) / protein_length=293 / sequence_SO=supercontig / SO=protein_coding / is_pseudo=false